MSVIGLLLNIPGLGGGGTPNIKVTLGATEVTDGGTYAGGTFDEAVTAQITCTIENIGTYTLTIQNPTVDGHIVSASAPSDLTLDPAQSVTSTITLDTATSILTTARTGNIHIASDDPDTASFDVRIDFTANPVWLLNDEFTTAASAPLASPRTAEPTGTLTLVQTDGQFSISSNKLNFPVQASPAWGDQGLYRSSTIARAVGLVLFGKLNYSIVQGSFIGFGTGAGASYSNIAGEAIYPLAGSGWAIFRPSSGSIIVAAIPASATDYDLAIVVCSTGYYFFIKGGVFTNWTLLWVNTANTTANIAPTFGNNNAAGTLDNFRMRQLANAWINANPIATSVLAGARSAGDTFTHEANAIIEFTVVSIDPGGYAIIAFREQDANNRWESWINFVGNIDLVERVAGVATARASYGGNATGHRVIIKADGTTIRVYSGAAGAEVLRYTYTSATNFQSATAGRLAQLDALAGISNIIANPITVSGDALSELVKGL